MKFAIDVSPMLYDTGVSHYRRNLVENLLKIDKVNKYIVFGGSLRRFFELNNKINSISGVFDKKTYLIPPALANVIWNKWHILPIEKLVGDVDVVHTSDWSEPPSHSAKVTTIHDMIPVKYPDITPKIIVDTHMERLAWVKKESRYIIVPSESTKRDLIEYGFESNRIKVIYEAPNITKSSKDETVAIKRKYRVDNYLISIGTHPRKNLGRVIAAFKKLSQKLNGFSLIIVGEPKFTEESGGSNVIFTGKVSNTELGALLTGAKLLVFPSLYEGLGIPVLDAFNCGVPVVTSNTSSMPEVSGEAAVLVDPNSMDSIADGILEALKNSEKYVRRGLKRVKDFSWEKTARETLKVYETAGNVK